MEYKYLSSKTHHVRVCHPDRQWHSVPVGCVGCLKNSVDFLLQGQFLVFVVLIIIWLFKYDSGNVLV